MKKRVTEMEEPQSICPNCQGQLDQPTKQKKKCPLCKKDIFVRTVPDEDRRILVTGPQAKKIDIEWNKIYFRKKWMKTLSQYGISQEDFDKKKVKLSARFRQTASDQDVFWGLFNSLILKTEDLQTHKMIYLEMALFLNEKGKDSMQLLEQVAKMSLLHYKSKSFIKKVEIRTAKDSCVNCCKLHGKVFDIDEALRIMPIPCKTCNFKLKEKRKPWCRCMYLAKIDKTFL